MTLTDTERFKLAEEFVRKAISHFDVRPSEEQIKQAALKAARALPPFTTVKE